MSNALSALGFTLGEDTVGEVADTNGDGTGPAGLKRAARRLGAAVDVISERDGRRAFYTLCGFLGDGQSAVLCWNKGKHWVTAFGLLGDRVLIFDPGAASDNISAFSMRELLEEWTSGGTQPRYAIAVRREED